MPDPIRFCIVGEQTGTHVAGSLVIAAKEMGHAVNVLSPATAWCQSAALRRISWHLFDRRPNWLASFSKHVERVCTEWKADVLLTTGFAPVDRHRLSRIGSLGVTRVNYLTDDPWNPNYGSGWIRRALPEYDVVCSPRTSNLEDLKTLGCRGVHYVRFGYAPELQFPVILTEEESNRLSCDVLFVGGADPARIPWIRALIDAGLSVALYGNYWERYRETRMHAGGMAEPALLRKATSAARIALCLVRAANRDGHVMRTFEIPAVGACMLAQDTMEHRAIFGPEGEAVLYVENPAELVRKAVLLLGDEAERRRLRTAAHRLITENGNTYADRLREILSLIPQVAGRIAGRSSVEVSANPV